MRLPVLLVLTLLVFAGCAAKTNTSSSTDAPANGFVDPTCDLPSTVPAAPANPRVVLNTTLGNITLEVFREQVPVTANNFLQHVRDGVFDGTKFHRIITNFMMQGGDPNSKDADPANDGQGGAGSPIEDEFHWKLRHDAKGVVSMANRGPNTGTSQFFITFAPTTHLDDKHAIFAKVVDGMAVVDRVQAEAASQSGTPRVAVVLNKATILDPAPASGGPLGLALWTPDPKNNAAGGATRFLLVASNKADRSVPVCVDFTAPDGVTVRVEPGHASFDLPAGQRHAFVVEARLGDAAPDEALIVAKLRTVGATATQELTAVRVAAGPKAGDGNSVVVDYIGLNTDGRLFDTSVKDAAERAKAAEFGSAVKGSYAPITFQLPGGAIKGFEALMRETPEGGSSAVRVAPADAYGASGTHQLAGRTLMFQLEIRDVK
ncbi:MAG: hypothetical protein QOD77_1504 [Thermoplasmata archaeon]|jgi:cyclophilin family peptidyl-prolyl cis-trans isomerase|nr:hypothetical protein [Thermoplasmata archaeon]